MRAEGAAEVSAAQIARLAGVGRAAVSNWRRRHADFPRPVGGTPASPSFALAEVEAWLSANGKLAAITAGDRLWQRLRAYGEEWRLTSVLADVAAFLSFQRQHDREWRRWVDKSEVRIAEWLPDAVAHHVAEIRMPGGQVFAGGLRPDRVPFWRALAELADDQGDGAVFEDLHSRYVDSTARTAAVTSLELATVVASVIPPLNEGTIFDPACGTGNLLLATAKKTGLDARFTGQEIDPAMARIAAFRLEWEGSAPLVRPGDSLRDDQFPRLPGGQGGADVVLCDPPTGTRDWGHDELGYDPRWEFGLPPRGEPELAWLQHCYAHLQPGGTAIVVMPVAAASRRPGRRVRAEMLRRGALRQVIALPPGLASNHALGLHLWVLGRPRAGTTQAARSVEMIDGSRFDREQLRTVEGDWWHSFHKESGHDEQGVTAEVPVIQLLDDDVDLTPSRYVERTGRNVPADHARALAELLPLLRDLPRRLPPPPARTDAAAPDVPAAQDAPAAQDVPMVTIAELDNAGAVDIVLDREVSRVNAGGLQPGDVLVPALDRSEPPLVVTDERGDPTPDRHLLRCDPERLDPYFLAGFLRSEANLRQAVTGSGVFRYDVRRARVPRLPLAEQRRYGRAFRSLFEFAAALHRVTALGDDVVRLATDGLTSGAYVPRAAPPPTATDPPTRGN